MGISFLRSNDRSSHLPRRFFFQFLNDEFLHTTTNRFSKQFPKSNRLSFYCTDRRQIVIESRLSGQKLCSTDLGFTYVLNYMPNGR